MSIALLSLQPDCVQVGIVGDPVWQHTVSWGRESDAQPFEDTLRLQAVLLEALDALLLTPHTATVVVLEPPLFALPRKQAIADVLLSQLRVHAVGYLPQSVCCVAGYKLTAGVVVDPEEKVVVPVYDYRELTPFIVPLDESERGEAISKVVSKAAIDIRQALRDNVVDYSSKEAWLGASALMSQRTVWPLITREKHEKGRKVWDSLFDMR